MQPQILQRSPGLWGCCRSLRRIGDQLRAAEQLCARIAELEEAEAEDARQRLSEARAEFSQLRLKLRRELDAVAVLDASAENVRAAISRDYIHPSADNADAMLRLVGLLLERKEEPQSPKAEALIQPAGESASADATPSPSERRSLIKRRGQPNLAIVQRRAIVAEMLTASAREISRALDEQNIPTPQGWVDGWERTYLEAGRNKVEKLISNDKKSRSS